jgi:hypothetical protein
MRAPDEATRRRRDASNIGERLKQLSNLSDLLELAAVIGFEALRTELEQALAYSKAHAADRRRSMPRRCSRSWSSRRRTTCPTSERSS